MVLRCLLALAGVTGCAAERLATTLHPIALADHARIRVFVDDASVRVSTADVAQAEMQVMSSGYDVQRDLELSMTPHGNQVDIVAKVRWKLHVFDFTRRSLQLDLRIPRDADLEVRSGDGSIDVAAIGGNLDIQTGDGDIVTHGARGTIKLRSGDGSIDSRDLEGDIAVSTGDGSLVIRNSRGAIRLRSGDGRIDGSDLDGNIEASSGDGSVRLAGRFDGLAVRTDDGSLTAQVAPGSRVAQPWRLQSGDGNVSVQLPRGLSARVEAATDDGKVTSAIPLLQLGRSHAAGDLNGGGLPIIVQTRDGSIDLRPI